MASFEIFYGAFRRFHFMLKTDDGEPVLSSDAFVFKAECIDCIEAVKKIAPADHCYERKGEGKGFYWFVLCTPDGLTVPSEIFFTEEEREEGIEVVKGEAGKAAINDLTI